MESLMNSVVTLLVLSKKLSRNKVDLLRRSVQYADQLKL